MRFACFGGAAAVADEEVVVARHRRRGRKFFFGSRSPSRSNSKASSHTPETKTNKRISSPGRSRETDFDIYDMMIPAGKSSALSTATSLDSTSSSSSCSSCSSSRSSSSSSLSSLLKVTPPPQPSKRQRPDEQRRSPAVGAAAVLVCLVMMMFGGRLAATLLTAAVLSFFPRQCPAARRPTAPTPERPAAASRREALDTKAVVDKFNIYFLQLSPNA